MSESYFCNKNRVKEYYKDNKEKILKQLKEYYDNNYQKEPKKTYCKKKYQKKNQNGFMTNIEKKVHSSISRNMRHSFKQNGLSKNGRKWENLVGYTRQELIKHLEEQFVEGMTWDNYGKHGWHIDHKIPKCNFKFNSINDKVFKECWSLGNLQPLWAKLNWSKEKFQKAKK